MAIPDLIYDAEKGQPLDNPGPASLLSGEDSNAIGEMRNVDDMEISNPTNSFQRFANKLDHLMGVEARGIERVPESARMGKASTSNYLTMALIWFSANCTANQFNLGVLGPAVYGLSLLDSMLLCVFGTLLGSFCTAFIATYGPVSGNRTLVIARFTMGYFPSILAVLLNLVIEIGYGVIDCIVCGLILSAVSDQRMSPLAGVFISAVISWVVSSFGIKLFHTFQRYTWIPQVCIMFILIGTAGPYFNTSTPSAGSTETVAGNRLSFFFLTMSVPLGWAPAAADFYVYFPKSSSKTMIFIMTTCGLTFGKLLVEFVGVGLGSALVSKATWGTAYHSHGLGALVVTAFEPLGTFGKFCSVILALGIVANNIPGTYSASLSFQLLYSPVLSKIPRFFFNTLTVIIYTIIAAVGYKHLQAIFTDFLSIIGYWSIIWIMMTLEEQVIFRRVRGWEWESWNDPKVLPVGLAALVAFCVGWAGAVLGMDQVYFIGPIGGLVGDYGGDLGIPIAAGWTMLVYPPLRWFELRIMKR